MHSKTSKETKSSDKGGLVSADQCPSCHEIGSPCLVHIFASNSLQDKRSKITASEYKEASKRLWQALSAVLGHHGCEWKGIPAPKGSKVKCQFCCRDFDAHHSECIWLLARNVLEHFRDKIL